MNYERLLWKYINHVTESEGTDFIGDIYRHMSDVGFTEREWAELCRLRDLPPPEQYGPTMSTVQLPPIAYEKAMRGEPLD